MCVFLCFRQTVIGLAAIFCQLGTIVAPSLNLLSAYNSIIPIAIYGSLPLLSGILCFMLPETRRKELPDSISDAVGKR